MADRKISDLTALTTPASGDYLPIVDISEVAAASKNKRVTIQSLFQGIPVNVGIGTSSPGHLLTINKGLTGAGISTLQRFTLPFASGADNGAEIALGREGQVNNVSAAIRLAVSNYGSDNRTFIAFATTNPGGADTDNYTATEKVRIDPSGNVGIGTTSPGSALEINAAAATSPFIAKINTAEAARIDSSGRLLVGTSTARANFFNSTFSAIQQVEGTGTTSLRSSLAIINNSGGAGGSPYLVLAKSNGSTVGSNTVSVNGEIQGFISFQGNDGSEFVEAAQIKCEVDGTPGANDMPGRLVFSTTADGAATPTERLRITSAGVLQVADAGNITVGTTTGTKIGTATTQKIGFYNATPVVQPTAVADATDAATVITQLNDLLAKLRTLGIIAT